MANGNSVIEVCAGVVLLGGKLLLATRKPGSALAGCWEYPGGKCRAGESFENCIARELQEELGAEITGAVEMVALTFVYPEKTVRLHFMLCAVRHGETISPLEGQRIGWYDCESLKPLDFAPADRCFTDVLSGRMSMPEGMVVVNEKLASDLGAWFRGEETEVC